MAQAQATTSNQNNQAATNGNAPAKQRAPKATPTAIEAAQKIGKILEQLSPHDRKRVLAFVSESNETPGSNE